MRSSPETKRPAPLSITPGATGGALPESEVVGKGKDVLDAEILVYSGVLSENLLRAGSASVLKAGESLRPEKPKEILSG